MKVRSGFANHTKSGLLIRRRVGFDDHDLFTSENDHNPIVAKQCRACRGSGVLPRGGCCTRCGGLGAIDEPERLCATEKPAVSLPVPEHGFIKCPGCGVRFATYSHRTWTGRRHKCGQEIKLV